MQASEIISEMQSLYNPAAVKGMSRFGIKAEGTLGIPVPSLRAIAKRTGKNHNLALELWATGIHEARILASMIEVPDEVTEEQLEKWLKDFDSWDICDQCCINLFGQLPDAYCLAARLSGRSEEFIKRAGFALMAVLAVHNKKDDDKFFTDFFPYIEKAACDERNFVKKAVNWALRQIGKRNMKLNLLAVELAEKIAAKKTKTALWIANNAIKELTDPKVIKRIPG